MELHHIVPQKFGGKYSVDNIIPVHQICHQQVTHGDRSLERLKIALTPSEEMINWTTKKALSKRKQKETQSKLKSTKKKNNDKH